MVTPSPEDERLAAELAEALKKLPEFLHFCISPTLAVILLGQLQLALRHPANTGEAADETRAFARALHDKLAAGNPRIGEIMDRGWNPEYDVATEKPHGQ